MGKVEKIVVMGVLFVIVLILVVSLDTGRGEDVNAAGKQPLDVTPASRILDRPGDADVSASPEEVEAPADATAGELEEAPVVGEEAPLLVAVQQATRVYEVPDAIPDDWTLRSLAGLADHLFDPTHKVYSAKDGDEFEALAERFYGQRQYADLLRRANEGHGAIAAGDQLLVPTHDDGLVTQETTSSSDIPAGAETYVAKEGESLWIISKAVYGKGHLWPRIWEANQDRLENQDKVPEGVTLVIPRGTE